MRYHFKIHKERKGYWAQCVELQGCRTQGGNLEELHRNMKEALNDFLDEPVASRLAFPPPRKRVPGRSVVEVEVAPRVALAAQLRGLRIKHQLSQKRAAALIGMKGLYSYQRLESSKTANPEFETLIRIKRAFPEFELDALIA